MLQYRAKYLRCILHDMKPQNEQTDRMRLFPNLLRPVSSKSNSQMATAHQVSRTICVLFSVSLNIFYAWEIKMQTKVNHLLMIVSINAGTYRHWEDLLSTAYAISFKSINQSIKTTRRPQHFEVVQFWTCWKCIQNGAMSNLRWIMSTDVMGKILILNHCYFRYIIKFFYLTDMPVNCMMVTCFYYPQEIVGTTVH